MSARAGCPCRARCRGIRRRRGSGPRRAPGRGTAASAATACRLRAGRRAPAPVDLSPPYASGTPPSRRRGGSAPCPDLASATAPPAGQELADLGHELSDVRGSTAKLRRKRARIAGADVRAERLTPGPVRRRSPGLPAASPQHPYATLPGTQGELVEQPALADARLPAYEEETAAARRSPPPASSTTRRLPFASEQSPLRRGRSSPASDSCGRPASASAAARAPASGSMATKSSE